MPAKRGLALAIAFLTALPAALTANAEEALYLEIANRGPGALRCQWRLAHWMTAAPPLLQAGETGRLDIWRDSAGALFLRRAGEARRFHIEALACGPDLAFGSRQRQIALSPLRQGRAQGLAVTCSTTAKVACRATPLP